MLTDKEDKWSCADIAAYETGVVLLQRAPSRGKAGSSLLFRRPSRTIEVFDPAKIPAGLADLEVALAQGFHVAGYFAYEVGLALEPTLANLAICLPYGEPLIWFGCYERAESSEQVSLSGADIHNDSVRHDFNFSSSREDYERRVVAVHNYIAAGETYQANVTFDLLWEASEKPAELYQRLLRLQPVPYAALLHPLPDWHVLSFSPELFFRKEGRRIVTKPMKGTAPPGRDTAEANANAAWLQANEKNRAENIMIVDLLRSDLGRICEIGSINVTGLFETERYPSVIQMTSTIEGYLRDNVGLAELLMALFPSGSIVGAPKIHTMRLLHAIEQRPRGVYTGAIGHIDPDGNAEFNVAIRTISLHAGQGRFGVGSGIVYDSAASEEYEECLTKASFLTRGREPDFELLETILLERGTYALLEEHCTRMEQSAGFFGMVFDRVRLQDALDEASALWQEEERTSVRLLLSRGGIFSWTAAKLDEASQDSGSLLLRPERTNPMDRFLRHKTTHRELYNVGLREARTQGFTDALFRNVHDELTEGAIHNIVLRIAGQWATPPLSSGVLPGVYRGRMLQNGQVLERKLRVKDFDGATEVYVCNSVRGARHINRIVEQDLNGNLSRTVWIKPASSAL